MVYGVCVYHKIVGFNCWESITVLSMACISHVALMLRARILSATLVDCDHIVQQKVEIGMSG